MRVSVSAVAAVAVACFSLVLVDGFIKPSPPMSGGEGSLSRARSLGKSALPVATQPPETEEDLREKLAERNEDLSEVRLMVRVICSLPAIFVIASHDKLISRFKIQTIFFVPRISCLAGRISSGVYRHRFENLGGTCVAVCSLTLALGRCFEPMGECGVPCLHAKMSQLLCIYVATYRTQPSRVRIAHDKLAQLYFTCMRIIATEISKDLIGNNASC